MPEALDIHSDHTQILWNFSRFRDNKRLTLSQNPHFYLLLPTSSSAYGKNFRAQPINSFQHEMIDVLTRRPDWVYLETAQMTRAFGNVWIVNNVLIFQGLTVCVIKYQPFSISHLDIFSDVCGLLEGEDIVGEAFKDTSNLWYREEPLSSLTSLPIFSPDQSSISPSMTATPTNSSAWMPIQDWREPIRRILVSESTNRLRITTRPPSSSSTE